jgi:hypothetical protein
MRFPLNLLVIGIQVGLPLHPTAHGHVVDLCADKQAR